MMKKSRLFDVPLAWSLGAHRVSTYAAGEEAAKAVPDLPQTPSSFISDGSYVKF